LFEVDEAATRIREEVDSDANIILGATFDESLEGVIRVSVVATGIDNEIQMQKAAEASRPVETAPRASRSAAPAPVSNRAAEAARRPAPRPPEAQPPLATPVPASMATPRPQPIARPSATDPDVSIAPFRIATAGEYGGEHELDADPQVTDD